MGYSIAAVYLQQTCICVFIYAANKITNLYYLLETAQIKTMRNINLPLWSTYMHSFNFGSVVVPEILFEDREISHKLQQLFKITHPPTQSANHPISSI